jgi:hypothetical protein
MKLIMKKMMDEITRTKNDNNSERVSQLETEFIKKFGIEISNKEYHDSCGLSRSMIVKFMESPWHYYKHYLDANRCEFKQTEAMKTGTAIHMSILEPELFNSKYILYEGDSDRRSKEYKEFAKKFDKQDVTILKQNEYNDIIESRNAILSDKTASKLINNGIYERSFYYHDTDLDLTLKIRPDILSKIAISDIKKCQNASKASFEYDAAKYRYDIEAAYYLRVYKLITGIDLDCFVFIAIEDKYPHQVCCYTYEDDDLNFSNTIIDDVIHGYIECKKNNKWPRLYEEVQTIKIPDRIKLRRLL